MALVPLLLAIARPTATWSRPRPHPAFLGLTTGGVWCLGTLYWTADVLAVFGGLNTVLSWLLCALLVAYQNMTELRVLGKGIIQWQKDPARNAKNNLNPLFYQALTYNLGPCQLHNSPLYRLNTAPVLAEQTFSV